MAAKKVVFVFTGVHGKLLGLNETRLASMLEHHQCDYRIYKDKGRKLFLDGGDDFESLEQLTEEVGQLAADSESCFTIGSSAGGYMALRQAAIHNMDAAAVFSAFVLFKKAEAHRDPRGRRLLANLWALEPDEEKRDARFFIERYHPDLKVYAYYPEHNKYDAAHAAELAKMSNVELHPIDSSKHSIEDKVLIRKILRGMLSGRTQIGTDGPPDQDEFEEA